MAAPKVSGIYEIVNLVNGKRYVGSAVNIRQRWSVHRHMLQRGTHHSSALQRAWDKYGAEAFDFRVVELCSAERLIEAEQASMDRLKPRYNIAPKAGNCLGVKWSDEAKRRHSARQKANPNFKGRKHSPETIEKMRQAQIGRPSPTKGTVRPPEVVEKTASAHRGRKRSNETRAKIAAKMQGSKKPPRSEEHCAKISAALKGKSKAPDHMRALQEGRRRQVFTEDRRKRVSEALKAAYADGRKSRERPPEYREKIAMSLRGRELTPEHRANVSAAMTGKKRGPYNRG